MRTPLAPLSDTTLRWLTGALGDKEEKDDKSKEMTEEEEAELAEARREEEERRADKYRKMEEERETMRQGIRDKVGASRYLLRAEKHHVVDVVVIKRRAVTCAWVCVSVLMPVYIAASHVVSYAVSRAN